MRTPGIKPYQLRMSNATNSEGLPTDDLGPIQFLLSIVWNLVLGTVEFQFGNLVLGAVEIHTPFINPKGKTHRHQVPEEGTVSAYSFDASWQQRGHNWHRY